MQRRPALAASLLVAALVPALLVTTGLRVVMQDWIVRFEYAYGRVPDDRYGLTREQRTALALTGLRSISPREERGVGVLREARLPDGSPAFTEREVAHMADVRDLAVPALRLQLWGSVALLVLCLAFALPRATRRAVPRGLRWGVAATVVLAAVVGAVMALAWERFFEEFHRVFFEGDTWRFPRDDTLIRLYPDAFWVGVAAWWTGLTVLLAALTWIVATAWLRRVRA